jgi:UDP-N-acetylglucosamine 2-epimerase
MQILKAIRETLNNTPRLPRKSPFGDGNAAEEIVNIIKREIKP